MASKLKKYKKIVWIIIGVTVLAVFAAVFLLVQAHKTASELAKTQAELKQAAQSSNSQNGEFDQLIAAVGKLMVLPSNEQPTVATVTDLAKLQGQPFFANAQVGDKVLIYPIAGKAILYRPSTNQIVELAPLNASNNQPATTTVLTLEIRNGSGKTGQAALVKKQLATSTNITVIKTGNTSIPYSNTLLYVAPDEINFPSVSLLQQMTSAQLVSQFPTGEASSSAGALLILGKQ